MPLLPRAAIVLCLLASVPVAVAGAPQPPASRVSGPPAWAHLFVTGSDGQPITDLLPEEISLKIAGRVREVRSLTLLRSPVSESPGAAAAEGAAPPQPFATNRAPAGGRDFLIILDNESFSTGRESLVRDTLTHLLNGVTPRDRLGLVTIPKGAYRLAPTFDREPIRVAATEMINRGWAAETAPDAACRTTATLDTLRQVIGDVDPNRLTVVVFLSGGLTPPTAVEALNRGAGPTGACEVRTDDYSETLGTIHAAPVDFHAAFVPENVTSGAPVSASLVTGLEHIAGATGNPLLRLSGSDEAACAALFARVAVSYMVGFDPEPADRTGSRQHLEVRVGRTGSTSRARQFISLAKPTASKPGRGASPDDMLRVATAHADLPLRVAAFGARGDDKSSTKFAVLFEPAEAGVRLAAAAAALYDANGKVVAKGSASANDLGRSPAVLGLQAKPGTYRLRVAASDAAGRLGTVDQNVTAGPVRAGVPSISSLVLGMSVGGRFSPVLQFGDAPSVIAYLEVYGVTRDAELTASFELATSLDGPALLTLPVDIRAGSADDLRIILGEVPIATMPPGDLVVRAVVGMNGQPVGTAARTLRKTGAGG
jgi:hypothetical protein